MRRCVRAIAARGRLLTVAASIVLALSSAAAESVVDTFERIFRPFETDQVAMSPSGRYVAYTTRKNENLLLTVRDFEANTVRKLAIGVDEAKAFSDIREATPARLTFLRWAAEDRLVFNLDGGNVWSIRADFGDRRLLANAKSFDRGTGGPAPSSVGMALHGQELADALANTDLVRAYASPIAPRRIDIVSLPRGGRFVILSSAGSGVAAGKRLMLRADAVTGKVRVLPDSDRASATIIDSEGQPRLTRDPVTREYRYRSQGGAWTPLPALLHTGESTSGAPGGAPRSIGTPIGFGAAPELLYCRGAIADGDGLFAIDTRTWQRTGFEFKLPAAALAPNDSLLFDDSTGRLVGVRLAGSGSRVVWVDSEFAETQAALERTTPKRRWEILDWGGGGDAFLIFEGSESHPGTYCLFRPRENEIVEFMNIAPWLGDEDENASSPFSCHTADGVEITGLLTRPHHPRLKVPPLGSSPRDTSVKPRRLPRWDSPSCR
jgi:hypothetical protein